jgi:hypothetical protein
MRSATAESPPLPIGSQADAERFIEEVRGDEPKLGAKLRIEERELEAGGRTRGQPSRRSGVPLRTAPSSAIYGEVRMPS